MYLVPNVLLCLRIWDTYRKISFSTVYSMLVDFDNFVSSKALYKIQILLRFQISVLSYTPIE